MLAQKNHTNNHTNNNHTPSRQLEAIVYQVENGKGAMPAWDGRLSEDEIQAVAAYVYDQAAGDKW